MYITYAKNQLMKKLYILTSALLFSFVSAQAQTEVTYYTTMGDFTVELEDSLTPITVDSFLARVTEGYYDGVTFHRVIDNFMIQGGDPTGTGSGNAGYTIPDEFHPTLKNVPGALSMAHAGPNTGSAQFFINLDANSHLDSLHTVFGSVINGFSVVQDIGKVPTNSTNNKPLTDVVMDSLRVTKWPASVKSVNNVKSEIVISPNPSTGIFTVSLPKLNGDITVTDIGGKIVYRNRVEYSDVVDIDLRLKAKGLYIINIDTEEGTYKSKLLLQ